MKSAEKKKRLLNREIQVIRESGIFDEEWYIREYRDVKLAQMEPIRNYVKYGAQLRRNPCRSFDTSYYLAANPDVAADGINPLVHYIEFGKLEGRLCRAPAPLEPTIDRRDAGWREPGQHASDLSDIARSELPSEHVLEQLRYEFDREFYLASYPDVAEAGEDPLTHYLTLGWQEGRDPCPDFSSNYYLASNPVLRQRKINPFVHYVLYGKKERRLKQPFRRSLELLSYQPRVSVIVPNYNHGRYLRQRIDSILNQTFSCFELLLLDDCSSDDSVEVIEGYAEAHPTVVKPILNSENSGNVFRQWQKGLKLAQGDLVWICESDDFCEPDFLENLINHFKDRSVQIAFGRIQFANSDGEFQKGLDGFREDAEPGIWGRTLVRPAGQWFTRGFGVRNVIANVGGCVFRRQVLPDSVWQEAQHYHVLGDWYLYSCLAGGGQIAYEPSAIAYFRQHEANTSVSAFRSVEYYREHAMLMKALRRKWEPGEVTVDAFLARVENQYAHFNVCEEHGAFEQHMKRSELLAEKRSNLHVLIGILGFLPGGGELFPIHLANALHDQGVVVSIAALDMESTNDDILAQLNTAIAVYDCSYIWEAGAKRFMAEAGVSLIHSHMVSLESFFFEKCDLGNEIPYLVTMHGSYEASGIIPQRVQSFSKRVACWVCTTARNLEPLEVIQPLTDSQLKRIPNAMPFDDQPFPQSRSDLGISDQAVVFTLVARGIKRKGWRATIAAFQGLRDMNPGHPMHLLLCGDGAEVDRHKRASSQDITFLGFQSRISGLYRMSDCAVVPSRFEGESFPLCIIQALQAGIPVIATDVGEIKDMLNQGKTSAGIIIEAVRDTDQFIEGLQEAMQAMLNEKLRQKYAENASRLAESFDLVAVAHQYRDVYMELLVDTRFHSTEEMLVAH